MTSLYTLIFTAILFIAAEKNPMNAFRLYALTFTAMPFICAVIIFRYHKHGHLYQLQRSFENRLFTKCFLSGQFLIERSLVRG